MRFQPTVPKSFSPVIDSFKGGVTFLSHYWSFVSDVRNVVRLQQAFLLQRRAFRDSWLIPFLNVPFAVKHNMYAHRFLFNHLVRHPVSFCINDIQAVLNIKIKLSVDNDGFATLENISYTEIKVIHINSEGDASDPNIQIRENNFNGGFLNDHIRSSLTWICGCILTIRYFL